MNELFSIAGKVAVITGVVCWEEISPSTLYSREQKL